MVIIDVQTLRKYLKKHPAHCSNIVYMHPGLPLEEPDQPDPPDTGFM